MTEAVSDVAIGAAAGGGGIILLQVAAGYALPTVMSTTGTVVAGVGTMHGALTAGVASFAMGSFFFHFKIAAGIGALVGLAYYGYSWYSS